MKARSLLPALADGWKSGPGDSAMMEARLPPLIAAKNNLMGTRAAAA
jgi:hypothetical protein